MVICVYETDGSDQAFHDHSIFIAGRWLTGLAHSYQWHSATLFSLIYFACEVVEEDCFIMLKNRAEPRTVEAVAS